MKDKRYVRVEVYQRKTPEQSKLICSRIYNVSNEETCKLLQNDIKNIPEEEIWIITRDKETNL